MPRSARSLETQVHRRFRWLRVTPKPCSSTTRRRGSSGTVRTAASASLPCRTNSGSNANGAADEPRASVMSLRPHAPARPPHHARDDLVGELGLRVRLPPGHGTPEAGQPKPVRLWVDDL